MRKPIPRTRHGLSAYRARVRTRRQFLRLLWKRGDQWHPGYTVLMIIFLSFGGSALRTWVSFWAALVFGAVVIVLLLLEACYELWRDAVRTADADELVAGHRR